MYLPEVNLEYHSSDIVGLFLKIVFIYIIIMHTCHDLHTHFGSLNPGWGGKGIQKRQIHRATH